MRMSRMIDQLLDFTRIRLGRGLPLERRQTDIAQICRGVADEVEPSATGSRLQLSVAGSATGAWDADRLAQLVSNLVSNAMAHGLPDQPVAVTIDGQGDDTVLLHVTNGGFIPEPILPIIFEPFRMGADRKAERSSGLGLGLYISQQIVLAHAGSIQVTSSAGDGTRFTVRLPRNPKTGNGAGAFRGLGEKDC
jgi:signal transduction histidine kinase